MRPSCLHDTINLREGCDRDGFSGGGGLARPTVVALKVGNFPRLTTERSPMGARHPANVDLVT